MFHARSLEQKRTGGAYTSLICAHPTGTNTCTHAPTEADSEVQVQGGRQQGIWCTFAPAANVIGIVASTRSKSSFVACEAFPWPSSIKAASWPARICVAAAGGRVRETKKNGRKEL